MRPQRYFTEFLVVVELMIARVRFYLAKRL